DQLIIPDDLREALEKRTGALAFFEAINASSKRNALRHVKLAKTEKTRRKRIEQLAVLSAEGKKLPQS
ncbi:MAG: YdeI/OmpD-associated family protein, partial [Bacteroidota bacterium]